MAARLRAKHQDDIRAKIQAAHLVKLLQDNAHGKLAEELSTGRIKSAQILLDKSVPSLSSTLISGDDDKPVVHRIEMVVVDAS